MGKVVEFHARGMQKHGKHGNAWKYKQNHGSWRGPGDEIVIGVHARGMKKSRTVLGKWLTFMGKVVESHARGMQKHGKAWKCLETQGKPWFLERPGGRNSDRHSCPRHEKVTNRS